MKEKYGHLSLERKDYLSKLEKELDFNRLRSVLVNAPKEIEYTPYSDGFCLRNKDIELRHFKSEKIHFRNLTEIWFCSVFPRINFLGPRITFLFDKPEDCCNYIASYSGENILDFPLSDGSGELKSIYLRPIEGEGQIGGPKEWFAQGGKIMHEAMKKYSYSRWQFKYEYKRLLEKFERSKNSISP